MLLHSLNLQLACSLGLISVNRLSRLKNLSSQLSNNQFNRLSNLKRNKMLLAYNLSHLISNQEHLCHKDNQEILCQHNNNSHQHKTSLILAKLNPNQPLIHLRNQNSNQKNKSQKNNQNTFLVKESLVKMMLSLKEHL